jgi:glycosyltransferase involved in cell wall biosynthesis
MELQHRRAFEGGHSSLTVSIVMPCLNEILSLRHCIGNAREALARIERRFGLSGEIVVADNGSTDGSQALAEALGARVVQIPRKGYGAALMGGFEQAYGRFLIMGDCDGSYDFIDAVPMIERLLGGGRLVHGIAVRRRHRAGRHALEKSLRRQSCSDWHFELVFQHRHRRRPLWSASDPARGFSGASAGQHRHGICQ